MNLFPLFRVLLVSVTAFVGASSCFGQAKLKIEDPAPSLRAIWVKGAPVTRFNPGTIYVLDFWATWCSHCISGMPHVSEISRKYKDQVVVIGVDVMETPRPGVDLGKTISDFVERMGDKMDYRVCRDDAATSMNKNWIEAANTGVMPTVFIVDQKGKIASIIVGYLGADDHRIEDALDKLISGKFDYKAAANDLSQAMRIQGTAEQYNALWPTVNKARMDGDYPGVLRIIQQAVRKNPALEDLLNSDRYFALAKVDPDKALAMATRLKSTPQAERIALGFANAGLSKRFYAYAIEVFEKAHATSNSKLAAFTLPEAHFLNGSYSEAVEWQLKVMDLAKKDGFDHSYFVGAQKQLEKYQSAAKKADKSGKQP